MMQPQVQSCWLKTSTRGVGKPISACPADMEKSGALCYPKCKESFRGVGPVCWPDCPKDYRDDGAFCFKPKPYGRGVGSIKGGDDKEKWGLLWYPKCSEGYYAFACCICSPKCPEGMKDIGISCAKNSYGRTAGKPL